ncbi:hypothetical protein M569_07572, partial [Genlisea aurea]
MKDSAGESPESSDCTIKMRLNPQRRKDKVVIGCGAGFGGDRPLAALKLLQRVRHLDYLVLECLAERTLAERCADMKSGGKGYDPRISEWMELLLPLSVERGVCIITNMGAKSPYGAQQEVLRIASKLGIDLRVGLAYQSSISIVGADDQLKFDDGVCFFTPFLRLYEFLLNIEKFPLVIGVQQDDASVYLGAAPIVECLSSYSPDVIVTSRVADASLFLAPMVFELGWNWNELELLAQGSLAGHLLECGCQLTGGYYMHPGDEHRNMSFKDLLDVSLPFAEVTFDGKVCVAKPEGSGGVLSFATCAEQLLYEVGDPGAYITPDVIVDFLDVTFEPLSADRVVCFGAKPSPESIPQELLMLRSKEKGWKGWGEISYGGRESIRRAKAAEFLVRAWMEESCPGKGEKVISYIIGFDSLRIPSPDDLHSKVSDVRLRMDGLFEEEEHALRFVKEFAALYTNGPAGGGGISTGWKKEIFLQKELVKRESVHWEISASGNGVTRSPRRNESGDDVFSSSSSAEEPERSGGFRPGGGEMFLYEVAHCRAGDKGDDLNLSIVPHHPGDVERVKAVVTEDWVKGMMMSSFWDEKAKVEVYEVRGIGALNVVVRNVLDGGVNCSRRIDRHGKTLSDVVLSQKIILP